MEEEKRNMQEKNHFEFRVIFYLDQKITKQPIEKNIKN